MGDPVTKLCMRCHRRLYQHVARCGACGSQDFFVDDYTAETDTGNSNIYVLLPGGIKDYIKSNLIKTLLIKPGDFTSSGYPVLEDMDVQT